MEVREYFRKRQKILKFAALLFLFLQIATAYSDAGRTPAGFRGDHGHGVHDAALLDSSLQVADIKSRLRIGAVVPGASATTHDSNFRSLLLKEDDPNIQWPPLPRAYLQVSESSASNVSASVGLTMPDWTGVTIGASKSFEYQWTRQTTLILMFSGRSVNQSYDQDGIATNSIVSLVGLEMFRQDTDYAIPIVDAEHPMVAFCAHEISYTEKGALRANVGLKGSSGSGERSKAHSITLTIFSQFFKPDGILDTHQMLDEVCNAPDYMKLVSAYAQSIFDINEISFRAHRSAGSNCQVHPGQDRPDGDVDCLDWFTSLNNDQRINRVPRCIKNSEGFYRCQARSVEHGRCDITWSRDLGKYVERPYKFTSDYACDRWSNLVCKMRGQPLKLWGYQVTTPAATCERDSYSHGRVRR